MGPQGISMNVHLCEKGKKKKKQQRRKKENKCLLDGAQQG